MFTLLRVLGWKGTLALILIVATWLGIRNTFGHYIDAEATFDDPSSPTSLAYHVSGTAHVGGTADITCTVSAVSGGTAMMSDTFTIANVSDHFDHAGTLSFTTSGKDGMGPDGGVSVSEELEAKCSAA